MTDTTVDEASGEELPELVESDHLGADGTAEDTPLKTRVLLPFLVPLLSIAIVAVLVLNISRVFLAGDKDAALAMGIVLTLAILIGASLIAAAPRLRTVFAGDDPGRRVHLRVGCGPRVAGAEPRRRRGRRGRLRQAHRQGHVAGRRSRRSRRSSSTPPSSAPPRASCSSTTRAPPATRWPSRTPSSTASCSPPTPADRRAARSELAPGKYTLYCTVPGHEAQGMKATLTVS